MSNDTFHLTIFSICQRQMPNKHASCLPLQRVDNRLIGVSASYLSFSDRFLCFCICLGACQYVCSLRLTWPPPLPSPPSP